MKPKMTRRQFGATTAASAATVMIGSNAVSAEQEKLGWIDAHVHVWTPNTEKYPLDENYQVSAMEPASFTPEELFAHTKPAGVDRIVLIQMSFYRYDNRYMLDVMKRYPGVFGGVGIVDYRASDAAEQMKRLAKAGVKGFRLHSRGDAKAWPNDPRMATVWKTAAEEDLAVCPLINPDDIAYVDALCNQFADTKVVIDHFARIGISGSVRKEPLDALCRLARFPNTHVKTSAFYALGKKVPPYTDLSDLIRRVIDAFGTERLMWASDAPFQVQGRHTYEASLSLIRDRLDFLSDSDKANLLRATAQRLFF